MKRLISLILAAVMLLSLVGCGGPLGQLGQLGAKPKDVALGPDNTAAEAGGVKVDMGAYVLDGEEKLTVTRLPREEDEAGDWMITAYDISVGDRHELGDFITVRIPYETTFCDKGEDPASCVGAKYKNEQTGQWEDVLFTVDAAAQELVIYTDHLSTFGAFHVANEGKRSAYITDVYSDGALVMEEDAIAALQEYAAAGGEAGVRSRELAARIIAGKDQRFDMIAGDAGAVGASLDTYGAFLNLATLGGPSFDSKLLKGFHEGLNLLGKAAAVVKIGSVMLKSEQTEAEVLGLYKDCAALALSFAESSAMGVASAGLYIFDQVITSMFEQSSSARVGRIDDLYRYYNTVGGAYHKARTLGDWRQVMIGLVEKYPMDEEAVRQALEREIDDYCGKFWKQGDDVWSEVLNDAVDSSIAGKYAMPVLTPSEQDAMTQAYKTELYQSLIPVSNAVAVYMQKKAEQEYLQELNRVKAYLNQVITVEISEDVDAGAKPLYAGYTVRFAPLADGADTAHWTGKLLGDGTVSVRMTLAGFIMAGSPAQIQLFPSNADPDTAEPELTVSFALSAPVTKVVIGGAPTLEEVVGDYADGTLTITEVYASEELKAASAASSNPEEDYGCDINMVIGLIEEQIGVPNANPFSVQPSTGADTGVFLIGEGEDKSALTYVYRSGTLVLSGQLDETSALSGDLKCEYINDDTGISVGGSVKIALTVEDFPEDSFYIMADIAGTKTLD